MIHLKSSIVIKPYSVKELAILYQVTPHTIRNWIKEFENELGPKVGYYYKIPQIKIIFEKLDFPGNLTNDESREPRQSAA